MQHVHVHVHVHVHAHVRVYLTCEVGNAETRKVRTRSARVKPHGALRLYVLGEDAAFSTCAISTSLDLLRYSRTTAVSAALRGRFIASSESTMIATAPSAAPTAMPAMAGVVSPSLSERGNARGVGKCGGLGCAGGSGGEGRSINASGGLGGPRGWFRQLIVKRSASVCVSPEAARHWRPNITGSRPRPMKNTQKYLGCTSNWEGDDFKAAKR